jgi:hypothetical protein
VRNKKIAAAGVAQVAGGARHVGSVQKTETSSARGMPRKSLVAWEVV